MKYLLITLVLVQFACANRKESVPEQENPIQTDENYRVIGIVHVSETECPLLIETQLKEETQFLYPLNLDEKFRREGMKIKFAYTPSKGALPPKCSNASVVSVSDVTLMR